MTIKVTITNSDQRETATIAVRVCSRTEKEDCLRDLRPDGHIRILKGGETMEQYVHSHQDLHIREVSQ